jgi:hypothetical protein
VVASTEMVTVGVVAARAAVERIAGQTTPRRLESFIVRETPFG